MVNKYYQKHKQKWQEKARERYQNLSEEEKDKRKKKKAQERYRNFTEEKKGKRRQYYQERKQKLTDYRRNDHLTHKKYSKKCKKFV